MIIEKLRNEAYLYPDKHLCAYILYRIRVVIASSGSGEQVFSLGKHSMSTTDF